MLYMNKTKTLIFKSGIDIFSRFGYEGATMDNIALNAGLAKGTLYYNFKSKEDIFNFIIKEGMDLVIEEIDNISKKEGDSISKLKSICKVQLSLVYSNRDFFKVLMSQLWGQSDRNKALREVIHNYIKHIEIYIKEACKEGFIREGDTTFIAYTFFGALCSAAVYELINKDIDNIDEVVDNLTLYLLKGIEA